MNNGAIEARRGQPVLFLGLLLVGWLLIRVVSWESPWPAVVGDHGPAALASAIGHERSANALQPPPPSPAQFDTLPIYAGPVPRLAPSGKKLPFAAHAETKASEHRAHFETDQRAVGHNLLRMAGVAQLPMPRSVASWIDRKPQIAPTNLAPLQKPWRIDSWLLLREGGTSALTGGARPASYGASQAGAVIAYRLSPSSRHDPAIYARASKALVTAGESEAALGVRAKPVGGLPVTVHAELRVTEYAGRVKLRPASFVSTGIDDVRIPLGLEASGYAQAGYVAGDFATAFADGRIDLTRDVEDNDSISLNAGAGAWGGAQRGATRVDIGPTLKLDFGLGDGRARVAADYRIRVAGNAEPSSGAAITLSAGF